MFEKIKFFISGAAVIVFLYFVYSAGKSNGPELSYDAAYEIIKEKVDNSIDEDFVKSSQEKRHSYIPAYSHIYISNGKPVEMAITLSLRNMDKKYEVEINKIFYYSTKGELIRQYLKNGYILKPLETKEIFIERNDIVGGSGANFLVDYTLNGKLDPIFETIMTGDHSDGKSYVFSSRGQSFLN